MSRQTLASALRSWLETSTYTGNVTNSRLRELTINKTQLMKNIFDRSASKFLQSSKGTTGLVGLEVLPSGRETLENSVEAVLSAVKRLIPESAGYRKIIEATYEHRMSIIRNANNVADIERKIGSGQIEELVAQARDELNLIPHMVVWKPWDFNHQVKVIDEKGE